MASKTANSLSPEACARGTPSERPVVEGGMSKSTQWTQTILGAAGSGASGSSTIRTRLFVPDGGHDIASCFRQLARFLSRSRRALVICSRYRHPLTAKALTPKITEPSVSGRLLAGPRNQSQGSLSIDAPERIRTSDLCLREQVYEIGALLTSLTEALDCQDWR